MDETLLRKCLSEELNKVLPTMFEDHFNKTMPALLETHVTKKLEGLSNRVQELEKQAKTDDFARKITKIQTDLSDTTNIVTSIKADALPSLVKFLNQVVISQALTVLNGEVNKRKYALLVQGIKGPKGEDAKNTRTKLMNSAKTLLGIDAVASDFAACHRLNFSEENTGIHARFVDLSTRDLWLSSAKKLKRVPKENAISISVDVPPCLRKVRKELIDIRMKMSPESKKRSYVKHLPAWPYFQLIEKLEDKTERVFKHSFSKSDIAFASLAGLSDEIESLNYTLPMLPPDR